MCIQQKFYIGLHVKPPLSFIGNLPLVLLTTIKITLILTRGKIKSLENKPVTLVVLNSTKSVKVDNMLIK